MCKEESLGASNVARLVTFKWNAKRTRLSRRGRKEKKKEEKNQGRKTGRDNNNKRGGTGTSKRL